MLIPTRTRAQNYGYVGSEYVDDSGYNAWADTNDLIVLYPQTTASFSDPTNPNGCWDWWGFSGSNYPYKVGGGRT